MDLYSHVNKEGQRYCTKGEYRDHMRATYSGAAGPDLLPGESWDAWFEIYFASLLETGEARRVGNHYAVYEG